ncbi:MAG TPA: AraC family transcriptional regulator [Thermoanaerobaculia bacterium]|nr:AraC family transcriptional regulator [Thermoanaerobaculia bacterium]
MSTRLAELLSPLATGEGMSNSILDAVRFMRSTKRIPRRPILYEPGIFIIAQGRKRGFLGGRVYTYDAKNYLVLSVPLPFECETEGTPQKPLLGLSVSVNPATVAELLMEMDDAPRVPIAAPRAIYATPLNEGLCDAATRLLECLSSPTDARILGPQIVREITYRVLRGEQGGALRALAARHTHFGQISKALRRMHTEYSNAVDIESLARESGMSVSAFHHNFKTMTSSSPLQYLKTIRLHKARMLMVSEGLGAGSAAGRVGYESPSQFSREFKRLFGATPAEEAARLRVTLG